jgi:hypothetical protein
MALPPVVMPDILNGVDDLIRSGLEEYAAGWFWSLVILTALVFAGLLFEVPEIWHETIGAVKDIRHRPIIGSTLSPWAKLAGTLGWVFIVFGVAGECVAEGFLFKADGLVVKFDEILLRDAQQKSALANERASAAYERAAQTEEEAAEENARAAQARKEAELALEQARGFQLQIAQANERAAKAEKVAEDEKLARVKIEERLAPRTLNSEQQERIKKKLRPFAGTPYELAVSDATDAAALMLTLDNLLRSVGWVYKSSEKADVRPVYTLPNGEDAEQFLGHGVLIGLSKSLQPKYKRAVDAIVSALRDEGIETRDFMLPDNDPSPNAIHVKIGNKQ